MSSFISWRPPVREEEEETETPFSGAQKKARMEQLRGRFGATLPGLALGAAEDQLRSRGEMVGSGLKKLWGLVSDPFGDVGGGSTDPLAQPQVQTTRQPSPSPATREDEFTYRGSGEVGPSKRELLGGPRDQSVRASFGGQEFDYTGAGQGLPLGNTMEPGGSVSFAGVSGNTPGAERVQDEAFQRKLKAAQQSRMLSTEQEGARVAGLSPEQRAMEQKLTARRELETLLGSDEATFVKGAGDAAAAELAADARFQLLKPQQQQAMMQQKRLQAESAAKQDYVNRIMELHIKRFNTNPLM